MPARLISIFTVLSAGGLWAGSVLWICQPTDTAIGALVSLGSFFGESSAWTLSCRVPRILVSALARVVRASVAPASSRQSFASRFGLIWVSPLPRGELDALGAASRVPCGGVPLTFAAPWRCAVRGLRRRVELPRRPGRRDPPGRVWEARRQSLLPPLLPPAPRRAQPVVEPHSAARSAQ